jgi:hypothetical protein
VGGPGSLGRSAQRILLGLLIFWAMVPLLVVLGFLGWAAVAAEGIWKVPFVIASAGFAAILVRWGRGVLRRSNTDRGDDGHGQHAAAGSG